MATLGREGGVGHREPGRPDHWLDTPESKELQDVLWNGPPSGATVEPGVDRCALPLQLPHILPPIKPPEHLLAFELGGFVIVVFGELLYRIRGFEWEWAGDGPQSSWPQSWWFAPDQPGGRRLPTQVQYGFLNMRFSSS